MALRLVKHPLVDDVLAKVTYSEPAGDLIPVKDKNATFSAGGAPEERRP